MTNVRTKREIKGFTLIELLVVIAVIAMLLAIITPALKKAKDTAKSITCRSSLRQMGIGFSSYYAENNDEALYSAGGEDFWFLQIAPYLGDGKMKTGGLAEEELRSTMQILKCPMTKAPEDAGAGAYFGNAREQYRYAYGQVVGSYTINAWVGGWDYKINPKLGHVNEAQARANLMRSYREKNSNRNRADVPIVAEGIWVDTYPEDTDQTPDKWPAGKDLSTGNISGDIGLGRITTNRHGMSTNLLYCDGHVASTQLDTLWAQQWHKKFTKRYDVTITKR